MALSSLQAQLAALNSGGTGGGGGSSDAGAIGADANLHPGSTFATSRRHDDAVGRGLRYSSHQGFAAVASDDTKFKPSLVYDTAREAADVPLKVLQETALASLEVLTYERATSLSWFSDKAGAARPSSSYVAICGESRVLSPKQLEEVLLALTVLFYDPACQPDCLNVFEYLLRRYKLEQQTATLLWAFWPHAETHPTLFARVLQLVDLTVDQSYVWLRPYCIVETTSAGSGSSGTNRGKKQAEGTSTAATMETAASRPNIPPRLLFAQHLMQNPSWLRRLVQTTQTAAARRRWNSSSQSVVRGIQQYMSWSAALILQGMSTASSLSSKSGSQADSDREAAIRTLFPAVLAACGTGNNNKSCNRLPTVTTGVSEDWTGWGYVLASAIAEHMELSPKAAALLTCKILEGVSPSSSETAAISNEAQADAITTVLSVVLPPSKQLQQQPDPRTYLPLLNGKWLGCSLADETFDALLRISGCGSGSTTLSSIVGYLYQSRRIVVAPLVATLFVMGIHRMRRPINKNEDGGVDGEAKAHSLVVSTLQALIQKAHLLSMWKDSRMDLVASASAFVLLEGQQTKADAMITNTLDSREHGLHEILASLHRLDPLSCERGIAHAIQDDDMDSDNKDQLVKLLKGIVDAGVDEGNEGPLDDTKNHLLPPRVALEHADSSVRLDAVRHLVSAIKRKASNNEDGSNSDEEDEDEPLLESLLRRWSTDDSEAVALASSVALCDDQKRMDQLLVDDSAYLRLGQLVLSGLYRWMDRAAILESSSAEMQNLMKNNITMAGYLARELVSVDDSELKNLFQLLMEFLAAFLESKDKTIAIQAAKSITLALNKDTNNIKRHSDSELVGLAVSCMVEHSNVLQKAQKLYSEVVGPNPMAESYLRQRCIWIILSRMSVVLEKDEDKSFADELLSLCLFLLDDENSTLDDTESAVIQKILDSVATFFSTKPSFIPHLLVALAAIPSDSSYSRVLQPAALSLMDKIQDNHGKLLSTGAIVLEAAARPDTPGLSSERLLFLVSNIITSKEYPSPVLCLLPALAFLEHANGKVRAAAQILLKAVGSCLEADMEFSSLSALCSGHCELKTSTSLGVNDLSKFLSSTLKDSGIDCIDLLRLCLFTVCSAAKVTRELGSGIFSNGWLPFNEATGGGRVAAIILDAMELAGETVFPLKVRWEEAGRLILEGHLSWCSNGPPSSLANSVVRMFKGITLHEPQIIISSGPSSGGGRSRSYSVGNEGNTVIQPYPPDMTASISNIVSHYGKNACFGTLAGLIVKDVLGSKAWRNLIFTNLSSIDRQMVASSLLFYITTNEESTSDGAFMVLPLKPEDVSALLKANSGNVAALSVVCDYISNNWQKIRSLPGISGMVSDVFQMLIQYTAEANMKDSSDNEFMTQSILAALSQLWQQDSNGQRIKLDKKHLQKFANIFLPLLGGSGQPPNTYFIPFKARAAALSLLSGMCSECPEYVVESLVPIMKSSLLQVNEGISIPREVNETISTILPLFQEHGPSAGFPFYHVLLGFFEATEHYTENLAVQLFKEFCRILMATHSKNDSAGFSVASLVATLLASVAHKHQGQPVPNQRTRFAIQIVDGLSPPVLMSCLYLLLEYAKSLVSILLHKVSQGQGCSLSATTSETFSFQPVPTELAQLAASGTISNSAPVLEAGISRQNTINFMNALLQVLYDILLIDSIQKYVIHDDKESSALSLHVWQSLLVANTSIQHDLGNISDHGVTSCLSIAARIFKESQQLLGDLLPFHLFLASISSLLQEDTAEVIQEHALQLLASRAAEIDANSPESELVIELVPTISNLLEQKTEQVLDDTSVQQAALLVLVHIAQTTRKRKLKNGGVVASESLLLALKLCIKLLQKCSCDSDFKSIAQSTHQLICSTALCCAALVRSLGTSCMACLPALVKVLSAALDSVNDCMALDRSLHSEQDTVYCVPLDGRAQLFQTSILQSLSAIVDTAPQCLPVQLPLLLTERVLLSPSLQTTRNEKPLILAEQLEKSLSIKVPPRILIPAASRALETCSSAGGLKALLFIMKTSIDQASSREAASHRNSILKGIKKACDFKGESDECSLLLTASKYLLLALVMKLSEVQLRQVFAALQEWQGQLDRENPDGLSARRYAFWSMSADLSKELGSIFLPCLGSALNEAKAELDLAVSKLTRGKYNEESGGGQKRRKLDPSGTEISLKCAKPILLCLEFSLRADAHSGGNWIRSDDSQRYYLLLDPLGKLLQCSTRGDWDIMHGAIDLSIVKCLTALASSAGNEQLWKPLNHVVLEACGNELLPDVRRAGLLCLLSLMQSLGEEYMVLLPECLPVLSELLEDTEEVIASLARECVTLAEELIGESLEENL